MIFLLQGSFVSGKKAMSVFLQRWYTCSSCYIAEAKGFLYLVVFHSTPTPWPIKWMSLVAYTPSAVSPIPIVGTGHNLA